MTALLAYLPKKRLAGLIFTRRDPGLAVLDYASNGRGGEDPVVDDDSDGPVYVRLRKILEKLGRLGRELDRQPAVVWVPINFGFALDVQRREVRRVEHDVLALVLPDDKVLRLRVTLLDS